MNTKKFTKKSPIILLISLLAIPVSVATSFAADKLIVKDATGTNDVFKVDDTGAVTQSGYLGLGTTPKVAIHAKGATSQSSQLLLQREETNANAGAGFVAYHNNASYGMPAANDRLGYFLFGSYYQDVTNQYGAGAGFLWAKNGGGIAAKADGAWTYTSIPTYFTFETAGVGQTARTERMRIGSDGTITLSKLAGTYGGGSAYVCVNNSGQLFTSETACP